MAVSLVMIEPIYGADNATSIIPDAAVIAYYACSFVFGAFFYRRGYQIRGWWAALLPATALYVGFHLLGSVPRGFRGCGPHRGGRVGFRGRRPLRLHVQASADAGQRAGRISLRLADVFRSDGAFPAGCRPPPPTTAT